MTVSIALGPGREFDIIRGLLTRWGDRARGIGDDAVTLDVPPGERLVVSTDSSVEGVHFKREWLTPREIAYRATAAALSDLAAMAATPLGILVALALPESWLEEVTELGDGIGDAVRLGETHVVGGDLTAGRELSLGITVLGSAAAPLERRGARPGDGVYVTGRLGGPLAALRAASVTLTPDMVSSRSRSRTMRTPLAAAMCATSPSRPSEISMAARAPCRASHCASRRRGRGCANRSRASCSGGSPAAQARSAASGPPRRPVT